MTSLNPEFVFCHHVKCVPVSLHKLTSKSETRPQSEQHVLSFGAKFGH